MKRNNTVVAFQRVEKEKGTVTSTNPCLCIAGED